MEDETIKNNELEKLDNHMDTQDDKSGLNRNPPPPSNALPSNDLLPSYEQEKEEKESANAIKTPVVPIPKKKKAFDSAKMGKDIVDSLVPILTDHISVAINDAVHNSITPIVTRVVDDAVTCLTKELITVRTAIHQVSTSVSNLTNVIHSSVRSPHIPNVPTSSRSLSSHRDQHHTPTSSLSLSNTRRAHSPNHYRNRSRSRSPISRPHRSRSPIPHRTERSRSPIPRPSQSAPSLSAHNKNLPKCAFCKGYGHLSKNCTVVLSITLRNSILRQENRCGRCFRVLNHTHAPTCEPPLCNRGCTNRHGTLDRHSDFVCPRNPNLTP